MARTAVELHGCCARNGAPGSSVNILTAWPGRVAQASRKRAGRARAPWSCSPTAHHVGARLHSRTARFKGVTLDTLRHSDTPTLDTIDTLTHRARIDTGPTQLRVDTPRHPTVDTSVNRQSPPRHRLDTTSTPLDTASTPPTLLRHLRHSDTSGLKVS